jgi:protein-S-isoprenylcysteine O-methyltransferase Ste14
VPIVPPPLIALAAGAAQAAVAPDRPTGRLRKAAAAGLTLGSAGLAGGAVGRFRRDHTTVEPFDPSRTSALVTDGPNAFTRNPMYVGMAGLLTAHALLRGGWLTLLPVAGFVVVIDRFQIRPEEAALQQLFGEDYAAYCRSTRRWL